MTELNPLELRALRAEVGLAKGLTASQSRRLVGNSQQELEADADVLRTELNLGAGGGQQQAPGFDQGRQGGRATAGGQVGADGAAEAKRRFGVTESERRAASGQHTERQLPSTAIPTTEYSTRVR